MFEKSVYSVFVGYRVLYMCIRSSIWCSDYPFPSLLFILAVLSNQDRSVRIAHGKHGFVSDIDFLFLSICLVCLFPFFH